MPKSQTQYFLESPDQYLFFALSYSLIFVDCTPHTFTILKCSACGRPSRTWITFNRFLTIFEAFVPHFYSYSTHFIIPESLLNNPNSFCGGKFKLNSKFNADLLFYSPSHLECNGHTVLMLSQWCLWPPLSSIVKSSLFIHVHSSPHSLDARLYQCHVNCSHCINND